MVVRVSPCPISVVVPTLNEESALPRFLDSLFPQFMYEDEVIVVDGGSRDETVGIAEGYGCRVIVEKGSSIGKARQVGSIQAANGIIFGTSADVILPEDHLGKIRKYFSGDNELVGLAGSVRDSENRLISKLSEKANLLQRIGWGLNTSFRKEAFLETEGYPDANYLEDSTFWARLGSVGKTLYDPELVVYSDMDDFHYQALPILGSSAVTTGLGLVLRLRNKAAGDFVATAGLAAGLCQGTWELSGHRSLGIIKCNEECTVERHVHHSGIGALIMLGSLFLEALPMEKEVKDEVIAGTAGLGFGMMLHGLVTTPRVRKE